MKYKIEYLGKYSAQYFQGYGACMTGYDQSVYGIGDTMHDALDDALECLAQCEGTEELIKKIESSEIYKKEIKELSKVRNNRKITKKEFDADIQYYYGILYSTEYTEA